jgi:hypothetical protein
MLLCFQGLSALVYHTHSPTHTHTHGQTHTHIHAHTHMFFVLSRAVNVSVVISCCVLLGLVAHCFVLTYCFSQKHLVHSVVSVCVCECTCGHMLCSSLVWEFVCVYHTSRNLCCPVVYIAHLSCRADAMI